MTHGPIRDAIKFVLDSIFENNPENGQLISSNPDRFSQPIIGWKSGIINRLTSSWPNQMSSINCTGDIINGLQSRLLGIDTSKELLSKPLFKFESEELAKTTCDVLIIPDASEGQMKETGGVKKSRKSLSTQQWKEIFDRLPAEQSYGIVKGVSHPEYTDLVAQIAEQSGKNAHYISTSTLGEFVSLVLESKIVVGMDSGTTHIASEVIRAVGQEKEIILREIFNQAMFDLNEYGVRGLDPGQAKILIHKTDSSKQTLDSLSAYGVVDFIMNGVWQA